jgi:hypothetical protein
MPLEMTSVNLLSISRMTGCISVPFSVSRYCMIVCRSGFFSDDIAFTFKAFHRSGGKRAVDDQHIGQLLLIDPVIFGSPGN